MLKMCFGDNAIGRRQSFERVSGFKHGENSSKVVSVVGVTPRISFHSEAMVQQRFVLLGQTVTQDY